MTSVFLYYKNNLLNMDTFFPSKCKKYFYTSLPSSSLNAFLYMQIIILIFKDDDDL